ncbi:hypothetical protein NG701_20560 [Pseudarthrobacter sp. HLT3-5]|uniref:hypothetical protein n=1 Tax=Pseudarthrobacter cellobiosi TaxID=2953654 RepID=UPI00208F50FF|nr:hypothetical protein [Pseudarthrobacter sp. HLT3-5]MCO4276777.1 hypothetical protein [Pseudarthrobacter sp. HLT3-5]
MRKMSKKNKIVAVCAAAVLTGVGGGVAFAYWTTTGSGTGSGTNETSNGTVVLTAAVPSLLTPGGSGTVTYTASNAGSSSLQVGTIHAVVSTSDPLCLPADFTIADVVSNTTVPAGSPSTAVGSSTLFFADTAVNQDACKGALITLTLTSD